MHDVVKDIAYSQLNGRFRHVVSGTIGIKRSDGKTTFTPFQQPVFLRFAFEGTDAAVTESVDLLAEAIVQAMQFLVDASPSTTSALTDRSQNNIVYFAMIDRFFDGNTHNNTARGNSVDKSDVKAFHGGDFAGLMQKLDDVKAAGTTTLWLSPFYEQRAQPFEGHGAFHGYWPTDFSKTDPRFGSIDELHTLVDAMRARGISLMIDTVLNHMDYDAPWPKEHPEDFHNHGAIENYDDVEQLTQRAVHGLPDFKQERKETADKLIALHARWVKELRPTMLRIDAARHIDQNFLRTFNDAMHAIDDNLTIVGEYFDGNAANIAFAMREAHFDGVFDFPLHYAINDVICKKQDARALATILSLDRIYPSEGAALFTFVDNHDTARIMSTCDQNIDDVKLALATLYLVRGTPVIQYGTENAKSGKSESEVRSDMDFEHVPLRAFMQELAELRRRYPELASTKTRIMHATDSILWFERPLSNGRIDVVINLSDAPTDKVGRVVFESTKGACAAHTPAHTMCVGFTDTQYPFDASTSQAALTRVSVNVDDKHSDIRIVGAPVELGAWNPQLAPRVVDGKVAFALPAHEVASYKLVRVADRVTYEMGDNRYLSTSDESEMVIDIKGVSWPP